MRTKIYKWSKTISNNKPIYYFDLYEDPPNLFSLYHFETGKLELFAFSSNNNGIEADENEVPEEFKNMAKKFIEDPLFEIELERLICKNS